ncbi:MAG: adenylate/guanylate cyclase domain-containing protein [Bacteroidota bacterium]
MKITFAWVVISILESLYIHIITKDGLFIMRGSSYDFVNILSVNALAALAGGLLGGGLLIFYLRDEFSRYPFGTAVLINSFIIGLVNIFINSIGFALWQSFVLQKSFFAPEVWAGLGDYLDSYYFFKNMVFWYTITFATIIMLRVNDKYGSGNFLKLITGHYHRPIVEQRIFMFLDIRSSTTIAEKIGHIRYFRLLNDFFRDITNPIIYTGGEIYQYVGDEVIVSWPMERGLRNANSLHCFFRILKEIDKRSEIYKRRYGLVPAFKAGLHCGEVTTGEIGVIKKDIVFSGDVLNTAARIQESCNKYGVNILLSKFLLDKLPLQKGGFEATRIGDIDLKGRRQSVILYTVSPAKTH